MPSMPVKFKISSTRSELKPCQAQRKMRAAAREMDEADENHEDGDRALREEEDSDDAKNQQAWVVAEADAEAKAKEEERGKQKGVATTRRSRQRQGSGLQAK